MWFIKFFYKYLYWLVPWWYGFTMQVTRRRRYPQVKSVSSVLEIPDALGFGRRWRQDPGRRGRLDVLSHPRRVQYKIDQKTIGIGDCDDHAIYWATSLLQNNLAERVYLGTVWAKRPDEKRGFGHVVCVASIGRHYYWADYRAPRRTIGEWAWAHDYALLSRSVVHAAGLIEVKLRKSGEPKLCKKVRVWV